MKKPNKLYKMNTAKRDNMLSVRINSLSLIVLDTWCKANGMKMTDLVVYIINDFLLEAK